MLDLGGAEVVLFTVVLWVLCAWVFYMIVKAAVRNGMLEADEIREGRRRRNSQRPYANLTHDEIKARIAEHEGREPDAR